MKTKLYPTKRKTAPSPISLEVKFLWWLKESKATIIQNHLGLNSMLLNYYKWRQIIHCKSFCSPNELRRVWSAIKFISLDFERQTFLINEKHTAKKEFYMHWKPVVSLNFTPPWYLSRKTDLLKCLLWSGLGLHSIPSEISFINLNFAKCKFTKNVMKPKPVQYLQYVHNYC